MSQEDENLKRKTFIRKKKIVSEKENEIPEPQTNDLDSNTKDSSVSLTNSDELALDIATKEKIKYNDLVKKNILELREYASSINLEEELVNSQPKKQEIIAHILKYLFNKGNQIYVEGVLELVSESYGFLRLEHNSYLQSSDDIYVAFHYIKSNNLKTGDLIYGQIKPPKPKGDKDGGNDRFLLSKIEKVNNDDPKASYFRVSFENLTPLYPDRRLNMETEDGDLSTRIINLFAPIGKGQRGLLVAPPKTGKTILLQKIANSIIKNHPEVHLIVLLIDERPEEVTDMKRNVNAEIISSTFDEQASRHIQVAEIVLEKSLRLVEHKKDVVILLDSITRLARAYNQNLPASGKILSGGVDSNALHKPKRFLGSARNIENGGSLTIIATALIETGSKMDDVIFEEFKSTGNMEIQLDRAISDKRIFPAINIKKSGTRKEELLLSPEELQKTWLLRKTLNNLDDIQIIELILKNMAKTKNNEVFLKELTSGPSNYRSQD